MPRRSEIAGISGSVMPGWIVWLLAGVMSPALAIDIEPLAPSVWAASQPAERRSDDSNSLIVAGDDGVLVVDAQASPADCQAIIEFIRREIGQPVRYLVNKHWHADHVPGNALYREAFGDALQIIGHATLADDIPQRAEPDLAHRVALLQEQIPPVRQQLVDGLKRDGTPLTDAERLTQQAALERAEAWLAANRDARFVVPNRLIDSTLKIDGGGLNVRLIPLSGHTRADLVVYLPDQQIMAAGDLLDPAPFIGHGYPGEWRDALIRLSGYPVQYWLPGHGAVQPDGELIERLQTFFDALIDAVAVLVDRPLEEVQQRVDLDEAIAHLAGHDDQARMFLSQSIDQAIARAYQEMTASPH